MLCKLRCCASAAKRRRQDEMNAGDIFAPHPHQKMGSKIVTRQMSPFMRLPRERVRKPPALPTGLAPWG